MAVLPDVLARGLDVVFCGSAVGPESFRQRAYYAHPRNRFWQTLFAVGLTPVLLAPRQYRRVLEYGIGLTDLAKHRHGVDSVLVVADYDVPALEEKIRRYRPRALAFVGKKPGAAFIRRRFQRPAVAFGLQPERIGGTALFVLPSPSPANPGHWDATPWQALADFVRPRA
ncbi:MAG: mismatch-specific DNA-glycosylase [Alphaproteobacteria bacterium]|nr:mismatch-specific DNA-glycosylase [Alphaproteobacteria bacterium]